MKMKKSYRMIVVYLMVVALATILLFALNKSYGDTENPDTTIRHPASEKNTP